MTRPNSARHGAASVTILTSGSPSSPGPETGRFRGAGHPGNGRERNQNKVPGSRLHHDVWKPVICALNGMVVGGGLHQVADPDIIIAAEHAELIDTHLAVGNVFALEPAVLLRRMPLSMVMQLALMTKPGRIAHSEATRSV